jgi:glycosyltransferase involved in cell wall biosynthesis
VDTYLDYIGNSRGEFSVAKEGYVKTRSGWFSERTASYLASGKPAIVQDTGFSGIIPCGEGLFAFKNAEDVLLAVDAIEKEYKRHCLAARRVAEEYFNSDKILGALLRQCGLPANH